MQTEYSGELIKKIQAQVLKHADAAQLVNAMREKLGDERATEIWMAAITELREREASGTLQELEYDLYFRNKRSFTKSEIGAVSLIALASVLSIGSYLLAQPGERYVIFAGMIAVGFIRLFLSNENPSS